MMRRGESGGKVETPPATAPAVDIHGEKTPNVQNEYHYKPHIETTPSGG